MRTGDGLLLTNAEVITLDPSISSPDAIGVRGDAAVSPASTCEDAT